MVDLSKYKTQELEWILFTTKKQIKLAEERVMLLTQDRDRLLEELNKRKGGPESETL
jgi:hypothetical protein